jgi:hypothetical protein
VHQVCAAPGKVALGATGFGLARSCRSQTWAHSLDLGAAMMPTQQTCLERIQFCISDLSENGIDLAGTDRRRQARLVSEHLEYFQLMLGYDSDPAEILELLRLQASQQ